VTPRNPLGILAILFVLTAACSTLGRTPEAPTSPPGPTSLPTPPPPTDTSLPPPTAAQSLPPPSSVTLPAPQPTDTQGTIPTLVVHDDFYLPPGVGNDCAECFPEFWSDCLYCSLRYGGFVFGPSPVSDVFVQEISICGACGLPITYRMSVDAAYGEGENEPERGFGLLLRFVEENYFLIVEISPSQSIDVWRFDAGNEPWLASLDAWEWLGGAMSDAVNPGRGPNRVGAVATRSQAGTVDISITVNGTTAVTVAGQPADRGWVGLAGLDHSLEVIFDNFEFEAFE